MELFPEADAPVMAMMIQDEFDIKRPQKKTDGKNYWDYKEKSV